MSGRYVLQAVSEESYKDFAEELTESRGDFHLIVASGGGDTDTMWAFHDTIICSKRKIIGTGIGFCHSAAPLILAACDVRQCTPNTEFMVHEDECRIKGSPSRNLIELERAQASEDKWYLAMARLTVTSVDEWRELSEASTYFPASLAKKYGIVDIILPPLRGNKNKKIGAK